MQRKMKDIAIFGAGGFGREVLTLINHINAASEEPKYNFIGFFDDGIDAGSYVNGFPLLGGLDTINRWDSELCLALAVGSSKTKKVLKEKIVNQLVSFPTLIHPTVLIGDNNSVSIGEGSIICAYCIITCDSVIDSFVTLNLACTVGHDTKIGKYSSFMPSVNISGEVAIGECVYVGTGAKIINRLSLGSYAIIGAGAVVTKSLPSNCTAVGVPARALCCE